jgi:hypothetical protein|tara:strand:- start:209 stop:733 length:525 start_codon:yes stop_codon:yes gene_type:complete
MNELSEVMQLIDKNSDKIPEGDYLDLCNRLKKVYSQRNDPEFFFDYDTFDVPHIGPTLEVYEYFHEFYVNQAIGLDIDYIGGQIEYLRKELNQIEPLKRKTKSIKEFAFNHYCLSNDLIPQENTPESLGLNNEDILSMAKNYIYIENIFRDKYRKMIERRLDILEEAEDKLYEL